MTPCSACGEAPGHPNDPAFLQLDKDGLTVSPSPANSTLRPILSLDLLLAYPSTRSNVVFGSLITAAHYLADIFVDFHQLSPPSRITSISSQINNLERPRKSPKSLGHGQILAISLVTDGNRDANTWGSSNQTHAFPSTIQEDLQGNSPVPWFLSPQHINSRHSTHPGS